MSHHLSSCHHIPRGMTGAGGTPGSLFSAPLLPPVWVLAPRCGRAASGVALPALRAVECRGVQRDGAGEGVPAAWPCSVFPSIPLLLAHAFVPAVPGCSALFLPTLHRPAWLQTLQL